MSVVVSGTHVVVAADIDVFVICFCENWGQVSIRMSCSWLNNLLVSHCTAIVQ